MTKPEGCSTETDTGEERYFGLSFAHRVVCEIYHFSDLVLALEYNTDSALDLRESRGRPADPWPEI